MIPLQFAANALLLWLAYYWLGIGEGTGGQLLWSAAVALAIAAMVCWLQGAAFAYFGSDGRKLRPALSRALRHMLPLLAAAVAIMGLYVLLDRCGEWTNGPAFKIASFLTMKLRKPVKPSSVHNVFLAALWLVKWMIAPALLLPMIAGIASRGWTGFRDFGARARKWRSWVETLVLVLLAFWIPFRLFYWVPRGHSFSLEMTSFVLRIGVAYLLLVGAWLVLVFVTAAGTPRFTQSKTTVSP
jgi:hypothetical protein